MCLYSSVLNRRASLPLVPTAERKAMAADALAGDAALASVTNSWSR